MKIKILSSSVDQERFQFGATYVINDSVAIDAGSLGFSSLAQQRQVQHLFLSHSHLDHLCSLPQFLDNVFVPGPQCPTVYCSAFVRDCVQQHVFNGQLWPDFIRLLRAGSPFVSFIDIRDECPVEVDGLRITPIPLDHVVPCFGFLIESDKAAVAIVSDTGPTDLVWQRAHACSNLKGVFLESAFPNDFAWLAERAKHLTPDLVLGEYRKLSRDVPLLAVHIKPAFHEQVVKELHGLRLAQLVITEPNRDYQF